MSKREHTLTSEKPPLPSGYRQLEYLESTLRQYIDTGVKGNKYISWELRLRATNTSFVSCANGVQDWGSGNILLRIDPDSQNRYMRMYFCDHSNVQDVYTVQHDNNWHTFYVSNGSQKMDNVEYGQTTMTITNQNRTIYIFSGNIGNANYYCRQQVEYSKIWENGVIVRDYIPALRIADNKPGLYDLVNNQFYTNAGTGEFQYA